MEEFVNNEAQMGRGYSQKNWVGVHGLLPKPLTLFMTKICNFPYPINIFMTWPKFDILFMTVAASTVAPNIIYDGLSVGGFIDNDEKVENIRVKT